MRSPSLYRLSHQNSIFDSEYGDEGVWGGKDDTESTWYLGYYLAYRTSRGLWMMTCVNQSVDGIRGWETQGTGRNHTPVTLCLPQIPYDLT
jgi:hypothetical protein